MKKKMKTTKTLIVALTLALAFALALPSSVFATEPPSQGGAGGGTLEAEFRYAAGESPDIPQQMTRFGFTYNLVSVSDPVLEGDLPTVRTYTYRIDGALSEEQVNNIAGLGALNLTEVFLLYEEQVDVVDVTRMPTNDVEEIPDQKAFFVKAASLDDPDRTEERILDRTGVTFSELEYDQFGRPDGYTATAVYRGVQTYRGFGYYLAEATFMTTEEEEGTEIYVVVASYATDGIEPEIDEEEDPIAIDAATEAPADPGNGLTAIEDGLVAMQSGNPIMDIINGLVPMGGLGVHGVWSFLSLIMTFVAIGMAVVLAIGVIFRKRRVSNLSKIGVYGEDRLATMKRRGVILGLITIIFGFLTLATWMYLDNFTFGMVWINENTALIGIMFVVTGVLCVLTNIRSRKVLSDDEGEEGSLQQPA